MLKGKAAIVTGSTGGIGLGIARALGGAGANLMLNGFGDAQEIERLRAVLAAEFKVKVAFSGADISKPAQIHDMVRMATRELGSVDILVNNAGIQHTSPVESFRSSWDAVTRSISRRFHAIRPRCRAKARNWGRIINIASTHGLVASAQKAAYVASKHGILGLTKVVALETATTGITCNAICPGWVLTPLVQKQIDDRPRNRSRPKDDLPREAAVARVRTPEQIGALAVFCSEAAAQTAARLSMTAAGPRSSAAGR
jgi:3-hydroxybutyrate dehydrogenase